MTKQEPSNTERHPEESLEEQDQTTTKRRGKDDEKEEDDSTNLKEDFNIDIEDFLDNIIGESFFYFKMKLK